MNTPDSIEVGYKASRVREFLETKGYDIMVIGRQDNFAWFTDGGNNRVVLPSEAGFSILVITAKDIFLVSQVMDGRRVLEEELQGLDIQYAPLYWYEASREEKVLELTGGGRVISDISIKGADYMLSEIYKLHYPLTRREIDKLKWLGEKTDEILFKIVQETKPGMSEHEVEAMFMCEYGKYNISCDVLLVGSDERIFKYRHPNPSDKKIDRYVLLHPAVRKWGLHANVTRLVYFGDTIPQEIGKKYEAACSIEAAAMSMCIPGTSFSDILKEQKRLYSEFGYGDEWRYHYQGGITGYMVADPTLCMNPENIVCENQAYDWFITITGVKVEELGINTGNCRDIPSVSGKWPSKEYHFNGSSFRLPVILNR